MKQIEFKDNKSLILDAMAFIDEYNIEQLRNKIFISQLRLELLKVFGNCGDNYKKVPTSYQHLTEKELGVIAKVNFHMFLEFLIAQIIIQKVSEPTKIRELIYVSFDTLSPLWPIC